MNYVPGLILFPDNWSAPWDVYTKLNENDYNSNNYDIYHWKLLEKAGAVFLPACGGRDFGLYNSWQGFYWSSTVKDENLIWTILFGNNDYVAKVENLSRYAGRSVRLVKDVE